MYCRSCGKQIKPGTATCPHCGREADVLSGGSGFWDLMGDDRGPDSTGMAHSQAPLASKAGASETRQPTPASPEPVSPEPAAGFLRGRLPGWTPLAACAAAALMLVLLVLALAANGRMKSQVADLRRQADSLKSQAEDALSQADDQVSQLEDSRKQAGNLEEQLADAETRVRELDAQVRTLSEEKQVLSRQLAQAQLLLQTPAPTARPAATEAAPQPTGDDDNPLRITVEPADLTNGVYNVSDQVTIRWDCALPGGGDVDYTIWFIRDKQLRTFNGNGTRERTIRSMDMPSDGDEPCPVIVRARPKDGNGGAWWRVVLIRRKDG